MSIDNFGELKTAVQNWSERDDDDDRIPEFVALAEDRVNLKLRIRAMESTADLTISSQETALPTGFIAHRRLYLDQEANRVEYHPPEDFWIRNSKSTPGTPKIFTYEGDTLVVTPSPDSTFTGKFLFWKKFTALSADSDTNALFTLARGLLLFGTLLEQAMYHEDEVGTIKWAIRFDDLIEEIETSDRKDRYPAGSLQMRNDVRSFSEVRVNRAGG